MYTSINVKSKVKFMTDNEISHNLIAYWKIKNSTSERRNKATAIAMIILLKMELKKRHKFENERYPIKKLIAELKQLTKKH